MTAIENEMHSSLHNITKEGVYLYAQMNRIDWLREVIGKFLDFYHLLVLLLII